MQTRCGPVGGVGAPSVTWVLDETLLVGDNNRDRVVRHEGARSEWLREEDVVVTVM